MGGSCVEFSINISINVLKGAYSATYFIFDGRFMVIRRMCGFGIVSNKCLQLGNGCGFKFSMAAKCDERDSSFD